MCPDDGIEIAQGKKLPPAPGCVDQQLTRITLAGVAVPCHEEIPPSRAIVPDDGTAIPYGLQVPQSLPLPSSSISIVLHVCDSTFF